ncbi:glycerophosphoryl diester phosphodiesterase membrane domain-containing protein [Micrococcoides hystricis]|uniref:Glycerophosphoryl diester phosphodiesterase membrane domain-containing protein n=1 Tax=Micrococcoides hystricis TaxID=1572761 RepID=A0ABV6P879_9MICC
MSHYQPQPNPYGQNPGQQPYPSYQLPPPPPQPGSVPLAPFGLGQVFSASWQNITKNFGSAVGLPAVISIFGFLLMAALIAVVIMIDGANNWAFFGQFSNVNDEADLVELGFVNWMILIIGLISVVILLPLVVFQILAQAATVAVSSRHAMGLRTTFAQGFRFLKPALGRLTLLALFYWVLSTILLGLFFASLALIIGEAINLAVTQDLATGEVGGAIATFAVAVIMWIVLIILVSFLSLFIVVRFIFVIQAIVLEGMGPFAALKRSWTLIRGRYWPVFGTYLLLTVIVSFATQLISLVFSIPSAGLETEFTSTSAEVSSAWSLNYAILQIVLTMAQTFLSTIIALFMFLAFNNMYLDLRFRKEGLHLQLAERSFSDPLLQRAIAGDVQAQEAFDDYVPGQIIAHQSGHYPPPGAGQR